VGGKKKKRANVPFENNKRLGKQEERVLQISQKKKVVLEEESH